MKYNRHYGDVRGDILQHCKGLPDHLKRPYEQKRKNLNLEQMEQFHDLLFRRKMCLPDQMKLLKQLLVRII